MRVNCSNFFPLLPTEGEDNFEQEVEDDAHPNPPVPPTPAPLPKPVAPPILQAQPLLPGHHLSLQHAALPISGVLTAPAATAGPPPPQAIAPAPAPGPPPQQQQQVQVQPTVITHAAVSHASVIQAVSHSLPAGHKQLTHIAPSPGPSPVNPQPTLAAAPTPASAGTHQPLAAHQQLAAQPIGHITVHPVAHLGGALPSHLPTLYPQGVSVSQPTVVGHITHTFAHHTLPHVQANPQAAANGGQVNSATVIGQGSPSLGKPTAVLAPQLVGQAVTMVTVPTFPVSTLKLA